MCETCQDARSSSIFKTLKHHQNGINAQFLNDYLTFFFRMSLSTKTFRGNLGVQQPYSYGGILVLRDGRQIAHDCNLVGVGAETDASKVCQAALVFFSSNCNNHSLNNIICDCRPLLQKLRTEAKHVFGEANRCVRIYQLSLSFNWYSLVIFNLMPNCITRLLEDDADGLKYAITFCFNSLYQYQSNRRTFRVESPPASNAWS